MLGWHQQNIIEDGEGDVVGALEVADSAKTFAGIIINRCCAVGHSSCGFLFGDRWDGRSNMSNVEAFLWNEDFSSFHRKQE